MISNNIRLTLFTAHIIVAHSPLVALSRFSPASNVLEKYPTTLSIPFYIYDNTIPIPSYEKSTASIKGSILLGIHNIGDLVNNDFIYLNASSQVSFHTILASFLVNSIKGFIIRA